eukprot:1151347-Pelagomonas_calceolata.AAC.5
MHAACTRAHTLAHACTVLLHCLALLLAQKAGTPFPPPEGCMHTPPCQLCTHCLALFLTQEDGNTLGGAGSGKEEEEEEEEVTSMQQGGGMGPGHQLEQIRRIHELGTPQSHFHQQQQQYQQQQQQHQQENQQEQQQQQHSLPRQGPRTSNSRGSVEGTARSRDGDMGGDIGAATQRHSLNLEEGHDWGDGDGWAGRRAAPARGAAEKLGGRSLAREAGDASDHQGHVMMSQVTRSPSQIVLEHCQGGPTVVEQQQHEQLPGLMQQDELPHQQQQQQQQQQQEATCHSSLHRAMRQSLKQSLRQQHGKGHVCFQHGAHVPLTWHVCLQRGKGHQRARVPLTTHVCFQHGGRLMCAQHGEGHLLCHHGMCAFNMARADVLSPWSIQPPLQ